MKSRSKKLVALLTAVGLVTASLAGCGGAKEEEAPAPASSGDEVAAKELSIVQPRASQLHWRPGRRLFGDRT